MYQPWAVKDPRLCVTLRFWLAFWTTPPAVILIYRHPVEVAESLARRDQFGMLQGFYLWIAYNRAAIQNSVGLCRIMVSYPALIHDDLDKAKEDAVFTHALRLYRAMEDGSAFSPRFEWGGII